MKETKIETEVKHVVCKGGMYEEEEAFRKRWVREGSYRRE